MMFNLMLALVPLAMILLAGIAILIIKIENDKPIRKGGNDEH